MRLGRWEADEERRLVLAVLAYANDSATSNGNGSGSSSCDGGRNSGADTTEVSSEQNSAAAVVQLRGVDDQEAQGGDAVGSVRLMWKQISKHVPLRYMFG